MTFLFAVRPDFGFGNPNVAAAFFALLAVAAWIVPSMAGKNRSLAFWTGLGFCVVFSVLLVTTASRGGALALVAGLAICWAAAGFPWPTGRRMVAVGLAFGLVAIAAGGSRMGERVAGSSAAEGSITARSEIWRAFPAMLVASPRGWGRGNAAEAYQSWFQEIEDTRTYKHLVSTHITWMVERGWGFRVVYLLVWVVVFLLCWEVPAALGVWTAFFVAGVFSHVGLDWRLWIVPAVSLLEALASRTKRKRWPVRRHWLGALTVATAGTVLLGGVGAVQDRGIFDLGWGVRVGRGEPEVWYLAPSPAVLGVNYGKTLRALDSAGVVWQFERLAVLAPKKIVLSGDFPFPPSRSFPEPYELLWLNPPAVLDEAQRMAVEKAARAVVVWGELRTDGNPRPLQAWIETLPYARWENVPGKGLFLGR